MTVDDYKRVLDVHLVGAFALTKAFVPQMKEQGHGRIIFQVQHDQLHRPAPGGRLLHRKGPAIWA